jgi:hypothetical protein
MLGFVSRSLFGFGLVATAAFALAAPPAHAVGVQGTKATTANVKQGPTVSAKRYFVEFRGRSAASYGHLYVMYGEVNNRGEVIRSKIAGLYPAGDKQDCENCSLSNWMIGHVVFVPSGTTATDGDLEEKYVTARYRVMLDRAQYQKLVDHIQKFQADPPLWNALWRNCVSFGREIANLLDLKTPAFIWLTPEQFVEQLRDMNGTRDEQAPLKDASNVNDAPVAPTAVAHRAPAHPSKLKTTASAANAPTER